jgi:RNA polymerase sigma-70 factor (ECF subfamily)
MLDATIAKSEPDDTALTDDELVRAARQDPQAFAGLYQRYATRLFRYLYGRTGNLAEAEDLTAQVFTEVIAGLGSYAPRGYFAAWLFTIARRRLVDRYRQEHGEVSLDTIEGFPEGEQDLLDQAAERERMARVERAVSGLDADSRELLRLRYAAELDYKSIARVLGRPEGLLRMSLYRLLRRLRKQLEG